jgi:tetratricopeptide (TPR) repeat protein
MNTIVRFGLTLLLVGSSASFALAQDLSVLPKYGSVQKNEAQLASDARFVAAVDEQYKGDRKKASQETSARGWQFLRQGNAGDAMRRFNQAWLLDNSNGVALWGMAAVSGGTQKFSEAVKLFAEAEPRIGGDIDFSVDYAKTIGIAGVASKDKVLIDDAFSRFARLYERAPQHVLNLQNWAVTLFYVGNYSEAWRKVKLAEAAPRGNELDQNFISALQNKMPRP